MFIKRLGLQSTEVAPCCRGTYGCPDIWELDNGDFAVIGTDITEQKAELPPTAGCGPDERMVRIPRRLLVLAKHDIPDAL